DLAIKRHRLDHLGPPVERLVINAIEVANPSALAIRPSAEEPRGAAGRVPHFLKEDLTVGVDIVVSRREGLPVRPGAPGIALVRAGNPTMVASPMGMVAVDDRHA